MRVAAVAAVCLSMIGLAVAYDAHAAMTKMPTNIPAQGLGPALKTLAKDRGFQVVFRSEVVGSARTQGASGNLTTPEALTELLKGTDLSYAYLDENTVTITSRESSGPADSPRPDQTEPPSTAKEGKNNSSGEFRVAQVDQAPAGSQAVGDDQSSGKKKKEELTQIVVTGTHIRGEPPASAIITIDRAEIDRSGFTVIGDVMRSLPQNFSGGNNPQVTPANAPSGGGNSSPDGGTAPNLRGLGSNSTLTLVNGRRLGVDTTTGAIDISGIPLDAVDHIDVITDGASATYGSDAVAGVVNIILKKDYDGAQTTASVGTATDGGAFDRRFSQLLGKTWSSGGALLNYEFDDQDAVDARQRSFTSTVLTPYSLLPSSTRHSLFGSVHQELSSTVSMFVDGLYTSKSGDHSYTIASNSYALSASSDQYQVTAGLDAVLPFDWKATAFGSDAEHSSLLTGYSVPIGGGSQAALPGDKIIGRTWSAEISADGPLFKLPAGSVRLAIGAGYRFERYDQRDPTDGTVAAAGDRHIKYLFGEVAIPLIAPSDGWGKNRLDLNVSGRYEDYSDFGSNSVPKIGLTYSPDPQIKLQASWGKSFTAPTLYNLDRTPADVLFSPFPDSQSPSGHSIVYIEQGGNPQLTPERAKTWSTGFTFEPNWLQGFKVTPTYYNIEYTNRIGMIPNAFTALTNPLNAPFVIRSPTPAQLQARINAGGDTFINATGAPYNPASVAAIIMFLPINISQQNIDGVDLLTSYNFKSGRNEFVLFANGTYLRIQQKLTPLSPDTETSGTTFNPPTLRARGGTTWSSAGWSATGIINFLGGSDNKNQSPSQTVASLVTVDAQLSYASALPGLLSGVRASLSVQNLFDKIPPYVNFNTFRQGFNYDSVNVSPLGRYVSLQLSKAF